MRKYLISENGNFYKANLHCHTTVSDGQKTPEEIKELYQSLGYSIVAYTDHDILIPHHQELSDDNFLALNGVELSITEMCIDFPFEEAKSCHISLIGIDPDNIVQPCSNKNAGFTGNTPKYKHLVKFDETDYWRHYTSSINTPIILGDHMGQFIGINEVMQISRDKGFFVIYNHPSWGKENYPIYSKYKGMHAMEMFNGDSLVMGYGDYNPHVYDDLLGLGNKIYCIGADDNHNGAPLGNPWCDSGVAFTMIKADSLDYRDVTKSLVNGNFYASTGPEIYELYYEDGYVHMKCSEAIKVVCTHQRRYLGAYMNSDGSPVTECKFLVRENSGYVRFTVIDKTGRVATTNAYFVEDLMSEE